MAKIERVFQRDDGSEVKIVAQHFYGKGLHESVGVDVFHRKDPSDPWSLLGDQPHPNWRQMSVEDYIKSGRPEMFYKIAPAHIMKVVADLRELSQRAVEIAQGPWNDDRLAINGMPVKENFAAWFNRSQIKNDDGTPLVLYHGTTRDIDEFRVSDEGSFGAGIYLSADPDTADLFTPQSGEDGENIMPVYVSMQRPFYVDASFEEGEEHDIDSQAIGLITSIFEHDEAEVLIERAREGTGHFGHEVRQRLINLGHDGIVARYPDGSMEYVALFPNQIKSAVGNSGLYLTQSGSLADRFGAANDIHHENNPGVIVEIVPVQTEDYGVRYGAKILNGRHQDSMVGQYTHRQPVLFSTPNEAKTWLNEIGYLVCERTALDRAMKARDSIDADTPKKRVAP